MRRFDPRVHLPGIFTSFFRSAHWRIGRSEKVVYLTFDDGPIPEVTPWLLQFLKEAEVSATFFCVGENVMKYQWLYQSILDEGHSVGNHTFSHWQGFKHSNADYLANVEKARQYVRSNLFRPPHGLMKPSQYRQLKRKYQIVMWDVISCDYDRNLTPDQVFSNVKDFVRPGSIITFHDSLKAEKNLREALPRTVAWLRQQGYRFEVIPFNGQS